MASCRAGCVRRISEPAAHEFHLHPISVSKLFEQIAFDEEGERFPQSIAEVLRQLAVRNGCVSSLTSDESQHPFRRRCQTVSHVGEDEVAVFERTRHGGIDIIDGGQGAA